MLSTGPIQQVVLCIDVVSASNGRRMRWQGDDAIHGRLCQLCIQSIACLGYRKSISDFFECGVQASTDYSHVPEDNDRNQRCDQAIFDCRNAVFFAQKVFDEIHDVFPCRFKKQTLPG
jgi:hypothetical protein